MPDEDDEQEIVLTKREQRAIARLQKLANTWPQSLVLFSCAGSLMVCKPPDKNAGEGWLAHEVATIVGISNDGGDA